MQGPAPDEGDEVSRQRQKHRAASLSRPVAGFPTLTLGQLADDVLAAVTPTEGADGVVQFLAAGGHGQATIDKVLGCLGLDPAEPAGQDDAECEPILASSGQRRLRTVAMLEAMLLKE
jgi:hypothetical protein